MRGRSCTTGTTPVIDRNAVLAKPRGAPGMQAMICGQRRRGDESARATSEPRSRDRETALRRRSLSPKRAHLTYMLRRSLRS